MRKLSYGVGVERTFPLHTPTVHEDRGRQARRRPPGEAVLPARPGRQGRQGPREAQLLTPSSGAPIERRCAPAPSGTEPMDGRCPHRPRRLRARIASRAWYVANGYAVVARNWRTTFGEIDLVASRRGIVVDLRGEDEPYGRVRLAGACRHARQAAAAASARGRLAGRARPVPRVARRCASTSPPSPPGGSRCSRTRSDADARSAGERPQHERSRHHDCRDHEHVVERSGMEPAVRVEAHTASLPHHPVPGERSPAPTLAGVSPRWIARCSWARPRSWRFCRRPPRSGRRPHHRPSPAKVSSSTRRAARSGRCPTSSSSAPCRHRLPHGPVPRRSGARRRHEPVRRRRAGRRALRRRHEVPRPGRRSTWSAPATTPTAGLLSSKVQPAPAAVRWRRDHRGDGERPRVPDAGRRRDDAAHQRHEPRVGTAVAVGRRPPRAVACPARAGMVVIGGLFALVVVRWVLTGFGRSVNRVNSAQAQAARRKEAARRASAARQPQPQPSRR